MRNEQVFSVRGDAELIARAGHLFASARTEFLCAARDLRTWSQPEPRTAIANRMRAPDFTSRKLLSPVALVEEEDRAHLRLVRSKGALVRISGSRLPHETILIDRRVMILAGRETPTGREYTVTTSQNLIDGVHSLFQAIWDTAAGGRPDDQTRRRLPLPGGAARGRAGTTPLKTALNVKLRTRRCSRA
jgi:hypothetical protein